MPKKVHLICNAHLDPVWLWPWEDGLAETLSTFRVAAAFCEKHPAFVFNHNEALLYRWTEKHDPALFARIQKLVAAGKWHIAGGSYVQPDLNTPCGESHIRQFLLGIPYFLEKFGRRPATAYNFDPFGQPEGYPQILTGCGFDSYLFCRPDHGTFDLPKGAFTWKDRSGSQITARRGDDHYLSNGQIRAKLDRWLDHYKDEPEIMLLWGIGNHGGGASAEEYAELCVWAEAHPEYDLIHSTPEAYFKTVKDRVALPLAAGEFERNFPGCYSSFARLKRAHRAAEYLAQSVERLSALAWWSGINDYSQDMLNEAWRDILFCEFHDILPGSSIQSSERDSLDCLSHATEILRRLRMTALLAASKTMRPAAQGEVPLVIFNPHGFEVRAAVECEYNMATSGTGRGLAELRIADEEGRPVSFQQEKEEANLSFDWRARVVMDLNLKPFELRRLNASYKKRTAPVLWSASAFSKTGVLHHQAEKLDITLNLATGLIDSLKLSGNAQSLCAPGAFSPTLFADLDNCWTCGDPFKANGLNVSEWRTMGEPWPGPASRFRLATPGEAFNIISPPQRRLPDKPKEISPIHMIEDGAIRTIVEAIFVCGSSVIIRHYVFGKLPSLFEIRDRIFWMEKDCTLKIEIPASLPIAGVHAETPYSAIFRPVPAAHQDQPNQRWISLAFATPDSPCLAIINDGSFAHSMTTSALYLNVLRSPAFSSGSLSATLEQHNGRYLPRQEQGEHQVRFRLLLLKQHDESAIQKAAAEVNAPVWAYPLYAGGDSAMGHTARTLPAISVTPDTVQISTIKQSEDGTSLIIRFQETSGTAARAKLRIDTCEHVFDVPAYTIRTLKVRREGAVVSFGNIDLLEQSLTNPTDSQQALDQL